VGRLLRTTGRWIAGVTLALATFGTASAQSASEALAADLVVRALALIDTPYRYGGRSPGGFDCSGFVGHLFSESAGLVLPRRSEEMVRLGATVPRSELEVGDLVFFNTLGRRYSHVGLYVGDGRFVHAPARGGRVRIERLADRYWVARYNGARRLDVLQQDQQLARALALPAEPDFASRVTP
jgi:cell wall-associated NlpC family hydrolase